MERTGADGEPSEFPPDYVAIDVPDGVISETTFVERTKPQAMHSEESLEEDDSFLSVGSETWDYEVCDDRKDEFPAALKNSQLAIDCEELEPGPESTTEAERNR
jgi:hypothetical protein